MLNEKNKKFLQEFYKNDNTDVSDVSTNDLKIFLNSLQEYELDDVTKKYKIKSDYLSNKYFYIDQSPEELIASFFDRLTSDLNFYDNYKDLLQHFKLKEYKGFLNNKTLKALLPIFFKNYKFIQEKTFYNFHEIIKQNFFIKDLNCFTQMDIPLDDDILKLLFNDIKDHRHLMEELFNKYTADIISLPEQKSEKKQKLISQLLLFNKAIMSTYRNDPPLYSDDFIKIFTDKSKVELSNKDIFNLLYYNNNLLNILNYIKSKDSEKKQFIEYYTQDIKSKFNINLLLDIYNEFTKYDKNMFASRIIFILINFQGLFPNFKELIKNFIDELNKKQENNSLLHILEYCIIYFLNSEVCDYILSLTSENENLKEIIKNHLKISLDEKIGDYNIKTISIKKILEKTDSIFIKLIETECIDITDLFKRDMNYDNIFEYLFSHAHHKIISTILKQPNIYSQINKPINIEKFTKIFEQYCKHNQEDVYNIKNIFNNIDFKEENIRVIIFNILQNYTISPENKVDLIKTIIEKNAPNIMLLEASNLKELFNVKEFSQEQVLELWNLFDKKNISASNLKSIYFIKDIIKKINNDEYQPYIFDVLIEIGVDVDVLKQATDQINIDNKVGYRVKNKLALEGAKVNLEELSGKFKKYYSSQFNNNAIQKPEVNKPDTDDNKKLIEKFPVLNKLTTDQFNSVVMILKDIKDSKTHLGDKKSQLVINYVLDKNINQSTSLKKVARSFTFIKLWGVERTQNPEKYSRRECKNYSSDLIARIRNDLLEFFYELSRENLPNNELCTPISSKTYFQHRLEKVNKEMQVSSYSK